MPRDERVPPADRLLAERLATTIKGQRVVRNLKQSDLADRMQTLGYQWTQSTVSDIERGERDVTATELVALALVLRNTVGSLLDPYYADGDTELIYGDLEPLDAQEVGAWLRQDDPLPLRLRLKVEQDGQATWERWQRSGRQTRDDEQEGEA